MDSKRKANLRYRCKKILYSRISILNWIGSYSRNDVIADMVAGITIGLTMMPQSMAYAGLAGLTPQYGLYSSFMGCFIYVILGTIKEVSIGPTSLMAILTAEYTRDLTPDFVIFLTFMAGCVVMLMGILRLGFLVDFISLPTVSGFQSATAVLIIASQLKGLCGVKFKTGSFFQNVYQVFKRYDNIRINDTILGVCCVVTLLLTRKITSIPCKSEKIKKILWFLSISRNALVVLITSLIAYGCQIYNITMFTLSGEVPQGLPKVSLPAFETSIGNTTYSFPEMCKQLGSGIFVVAIVQVLANVAIAKAFAAGKIVDATQEMLTLGICNIFGGFVQSMPTCGAFTRSAVSDASGVRTPLSGFYSGTLIILALTFLTPYFYFIPKSTLAAVLISAVLFMVDYNIIIPLWRSNKLDCFTTIITFVVSLLYGVEMGLLIGVLINVANLLRLWARPHIEYEIIKTNEGEQYLKITPSIGIFFPAADFLREEITKIIRQPENARQPVLIDCKYIAATDYTAAKGIESIINDFSDRNQQITFLNVNAKVKRIIGITAKTIQYVSHESRLNERVEGDREENNVSNLYPLPLDQEIETQSMLKDSEVIASGEKLSEVLIMGEMRRKSVPQDLSQVKLLGEQ